MSNQLTPQVDVGNLTIQGLGSFLPLLATLTADDVQPMAMIQMETLGAVFPINGEYAAKVPDCLQRCNSTRLDRLGIAVGWRKGDAASLMAKSTGGQAISLLSVCLMSLFSDRTGEVLLAISQRSLSRSFSVSSGAQLGQVAGQLSSKLAILGFNNLLARQVTRIYDVYQQLNAVFPNDLLEVMTTESAAELLHAISRALTEENLLVRISGTKATGYILGLVMMMFPDDLLLTVDNLIVHEGQRNRILLEIPTGENIGQTTIRIENLLEIYPILSLSIGIEKRNGKRLQSAGYFRWESWVVDRLRLAFVDHGVNCSEEIRIACTKLLLRLPSEMKGRLPIIGREKQNRLPEPGLISLLGKYPNSRMLQVCQQQFQISLIEPGDGTVCSAFEELVDVFESKVQHKVFCSCEKKCDLRRGWKKEPDFFYRCELRILWNSLGYALDSGLAALFIDAGTGATIQNHGMIGNLATRFIYMRNGVERYDISCQSFDDHIKYSIFGTRYNGIINEHGSSSHIAKSDSSTLYPDALRRLALARDNRVSYHLLDGKLQFNGRYYTNLLSERAPERSISTESLYAAHNIIKPDYMGAHSSVTFTIYERSNHLELRCAFRFSGSETPLDLSPVIVASFGIRDSEPCGHSRDAVLDPDKALNTITTSVKAPRAPEKKIAIVQVAGNATAQFLACEKGTAAIIQRYSCLNCAYEEAIKNEIRMIIVG